MPIERDFPFWLHGKPMFRPWGYSKERWDAENAFNKAATEEKRKKYLKKDLTYVLKSSITISYIPFNGDSYAKRTT